MKNEKRTYTEKEIQEMNVADLQYLLFSRSRATKNPITRSTMNSMTRNIKEALFLDYYNK